MLDLIASQRLREPSPWELAQWRAAAKSERSSWERAFDGARFCYAAEDALRALDGELRRDKLWCGAPAVVTSSCMPTELVRIEYYVARNLFSWIRADYVAINAGKATRWDDKVADGFGARAVDPNHSFSQSSGPSQGTVTASDANFSGQSTVTFDGTDDGYDSTIAASNWAFCHQAQTTYAIVRRPAAATKAICATTNFAGTSGYDLIGLTGSVSVDLYNGGTPVLNPNINLASGFPANNTRLIRFRFALTDTPDAVLASSPGGLSTTLDASTGVGAGAPFAAMHVGSRAGGSLPYAGQIADLAWLVGTSSAVDAAFARYALLRYGTGA